MIHHPVTQSQPPTYVSNLSYSNQQPLAYSNQQPLTYSNSNQQNIIYTNPNQQNITYINQPFSHQQNSQSQSYYSQPIVSSNQTYANYASFNNNEPVKINPVYFEPSKFNFQNEPI